MSPSYPLPTDSVAAWEHQRAATPQNPGLLFSRYVPFGAVNDPELKRQMLSTVQTASQRIDKRLTQARKDRWLQSARAMGARPFRMDTAWRLIAGLGQKGPLEVGFTFDRYGLPYLPGSSLKGIARAYSRLVLDQNETDDTVAIFGRGSDAPGEDDSQAGHAIFFDAICEQPPTLDIDVMTPHYAPYYQEQDSPSPVTAPHDGHNPVPIPFLTVAAGTPFLFAVGWRGQLSDEAARLHDLAQSWLVGGLTSLGAGAKTSAGYGYFTPLGELEEPTPQVVADPDEIHVRQLMDRLDALKGSEIPPQLHPYIQEWRTFEGSDELRNQLAQAIMRTFERAPSGYQKRQRSKSWYEELTRSLQS